MPKDVLGRVHHIDSRTLDKVINEELIDVTITSPPYFDLKDYGYDNQIGFGQSYDEYLKDLKEVFEKVYKITKPTGSLWVIIDAFRKDGEVVPLPFDFSNKIKDLGWKLQEIIIWGKDRTVPWAHKGQMRSLFEYILMFSKTEKYKFDIDSVRNFHSLKKWWVKYPERYNPKGKTPEAIWNFEIPTQGSWGDGYIRHFCPLPEELIAQILKITTTENDVVLDCFAGSGAVLSKADNMKRNFIGFEMNKEYIEMFQKYLNETGKKKRREYEIDQKNTLGQSEFEKLILDLRALKFGRVFYKKLVDNGLDQIDWIFVRKSNKSPKKENHIIVVDYKILVKKGCKIDDLKIAIDKIISKAPLSKFGIEAELSFITNSEDFVNILKPKKLYTYTSRITHSFLEKFDIERLHSKRLKSEVLISNIKVELNEKDFE